MRGIVAAATPHQRPDAGHVAVESSAGEEAPLS
jgi:hypothetical protein